MNTLTTRCHLLAAGLLLLLACGGGGGGEANPALSVFIDQDSSLPTSPYEEESDGADSTESTSDAPIDDDSVIDVKEDEPPGNSGPTGVSESADGRYLVLTARLVDPTIQAIQVWVYDHLLRETSLVSVNGEGMPADRDCSYPSISADGSIIAFQSAATNLVLGDTNDRIDVFVHDRTTRLTIRASLCEDGREANRDCVVPILSKNGKHVAFVSEAENLVPGDGNRRRHVFVRSLETGGRLSRVSLTGDDEENGRDCTCLAVSPDGRFVTFSASGFPRRRPAGDAPCLYVYDRLIQEIVPMTTSPAPFLLVDSASSQGKAKDKKKSPKSSAGKKKGKKD